MFTFNRNYRDLGQVAPYLPAFLAAYERLEGGRGFVYNDDFRGQVCAEIEDPGHTHARNGACGCGEDTAIYLLQTLRRAKMVEAQVAERMAAGYQPLETLTEVTRFAHVVEYGSYHDVTGWKEWEDVRVVPDAQGRPEVVLPKGRRTHGFRLGGGHLLVLAA
jgi:hypothetical protein